MTTRRKRARESLTLSTPRSIATKRPKRTRDQGESVADTISLPTDDDLNTISHNAVAPSESPPLSPLSSESGVASGSSIDLGDESDNITEMHSCDELVCLAEPLPPFQDTDLRSLSLVPDSTTHSPTNCQLNTTLGKVESSTDFSGHHFIVGSLDTTSCNSANTEPLPQSYKAQPSNPSKLNSFGFFKVQPSIDDVPGNKTTVDTVPLEGEQAHVEATSCVTGQSEFLCTSSTRIAIPVGDYLLLATVKSDDVAEMGDIPDDSIKYNNFGLLYNGDTIHPCARYFLTCEGLVPSRVIPIVVPSTCTAVEEASKAVHHGTKQRRPNRRKQTGQWKVIGEPVKTIEYLKEGQVTKIRRQYFIGIQHKKKEIYVRDCVLMRSGSRKRDKPYIAKIASIWKEPGRGEVMMTVFWYYRPEDVVGSQLVDVQKDELFASQHHDDNSVHCIEDKCSVLGLREYCRYQAQREKCRMWPNTVSDVKPQAKTFLCYRAYNHIDCRIIYKQ